jgi:hypothetical protein
MKNSSVRPLGVIVQEMITDMAKICATAKKPVSWQSKFYTAVPYINALRYTDKLTDAVGCEDAKTQVLYMLGNLQTYRGETAKRIKSELKSMLN